MTVPPSGVGKIVVSSDAAEELLRAAQSLPVYDGKAYYSFELQAEIHRHIRAFCPDIFDSIVARIREKLAESPYIALVKGLKVDEEHRLFVAINRAFGDLVASPFKKPRAQLVHHIHPRTDLSATKGKKYETEKYHTDTADWEPPVRLISMACIRADGGGGGKSLVMDIHAIREELKKRGGDNILQVLESRPVPFQLADYLGGGVVRRSVLTASDICWRRYTMEKALANLGETLDSELNAALNEFEEVIESGLGQLEFLMEEGEWLFLDNLKTLHARTPIEDAHLSNRFMIRSWVQTSVYN
jgi:alpha-ketoglutarate-dependent taurine dioxygenase